MLLLLVMFQSYQDFSPWIVKSVLVKQYFWKLLVLCTFGYGKIVMDIHMTYTFTTDNGFVGFDVKAIKSYSLLRLKTLLESIHNLRRVIYLLLKYVIWLYRTALLRVYLCDVFVYVIQFLHSIYLCICAYIVVVYTHMHYLHFYVYVHTVSCVKFEGNAFICGISYKIFLQKHKYQEKFLCLKIHE